MALNASKIKGGNGGSNQELIAVGNYPARVAQVLDLGLQARRPYQGKEKGPVNMLWVTYELVTEFMKDADGKELEDKPRWISEQMNLFSLDQENAISTKRISGIDAAGELNGDWGRVVGMACTVQVVHSKDGKYANIGAVSPEMKGMSTPELANDARVFDMDEPDLEVFNELPEFLQKKMTGNIEFKGSVLEQAIAGGTTETAKENSTVEDDLDDDIPY